MPREVIIKCSLCSKKIENVSAKLYVSRIIPGQWNYTMAAYSHHGDICDDCLTKLEKKLIKRVTRKKKEK